MEDKFKYKVPIDVKAEVLAANIHENEGIPLDKIFINNLGISERGFRMDILKAEKKSDNFQGSETLSIDVSRVGIYDTLPEALFHSPPRKELGKKKESIVESSKRSRKDEENARKFFKPIEKEFNKLKIQIELEERKLISGLKVNYESDLFFQLIPQLSEIDKKFWPLIVDIFPYINKMRGDLNAVSLLCMDLLNMPVNTKISCAYTETPNSTKSNELGDIFCNETFVVGTQVPIYMPQVIMEIGPIHKKDAPKFEYGNELWQLINFIRIYFIPIDCDFSIDLTFFRDDRTFYLRSDVPESLGKTTII